MSLKENKKNILILGSKGRLGTYLKKKFDNKNYNFFYDDKRLDLAIYKNLESLLKENQPNIIINTIALTDVNYCESNVDQAFKSNTQVVKNIATYYHLENCQFYFIQISSDQIYFGDGPHDENSICQPVNVYSLTKYFGEFYANKINSCIIRTNFFDIFEDKKHFSFLNFAINNLRNNEKINGYSDIFYTPVHISSLSDLIMYLCDKPINGIYNFGCKKGISKLDFIKKISLKFKFNSNLINSVISSNDQKIARPKDMRLDCLKLETDISWKISDIDEEISKIEN